MANSYYDGGTDRAAKVNRLFAAIAPRYDLINDLQSFGLHRFWKRRLVQLSGVRKGDRALDICCGTGDIAALLAVRGARVAALDFSRPMIEIALQRGQPIAANRALFVQGDALHLPFAQEAFDVVTMGYGLRNLASFQQGVREMYRVTKPGGRLLILDFGKPDWLPWRYFYFTYLKCCVPVFGQVFCGNSRAYGYILESLRHYPAQHGVAGLMRACPCVNVQIIRFLGGVMTINYGEKRWKREDSGHERGVRQAMAIRHERNSKTP
jgi:demethylmenaquinone methyltransferase/2-methoxy-6-polyprenyl-1,4-benzoquinol methylase